MSNLPRLGVTAIWVNPISEQVALQESYHGYGVQNFLDMDPHFGDREDSREMVKIARTTWHQTSLCAGAAGDLLKSGLTQRIIEAIKEA